MFVGYRYTYAERTRIIIIIIVKNTEMQFFSFVFN